MIVNIRFYEDQEGSCVEGIYGKGEFFAKGKTMDQAFKRFFKSIETTMEEHMKLYGNIDQIVDPEDQDEET